MTNMICCPVCPEHPVATTHVGSNCFRCPSCSELVFAVKNPFESDAEHVGISNASGQLREIPDDLLVHSIVDQSPQADPPRNMIIEFNDGASAMVIQASSENSHYTNRTRKQLDKTACALNRDVLHAYLPVELMDRIRTQSDGDKVA